MLSNFRPVALALSALVALPTSLWTLSGVREEALANAALRQAEAEYRQSEARLVEARLEQERSLQAEKLRILAEDTRIRREREEETWKRYVVAKALHDKCEGERAQLESRAEFLHTQCVAAQAVVSECRGEKGRSGGVGAAVGALAVGLLCASNPVGWATCGSLAAGGAIGGAAIGGSGKCPEAPECPADSRYWLGASLTEAGLQALPVCAAPEAPVFQ